MHETTEAREFFQAYAQALLNRDAKAIAKHYSVPGLIAAPEQLIAISEATQTEEFFASAFDQYAGINKADPEVRIVAARRVL